jgi:zinc-ribbon domain
MIYHWKLETGHQISVDNEGAQTVVTISHTSTGQQQRTSNSFTTGIWIAPPEMTMTPTGGMLKIFTPSGASILQIQGNSIHLQSQSGTSQAATSTSSSSFSARSEPMQMGNMQMNMSPMSMKMGDMELNMGATASQKRFCTECGAAVKPTDKFCASCGQKLGS